MYFFQGIIGPPGVAGYPGLKGKKVFNFSFK